MRASLVFGALINVAVKLHFFNALNMFPNPARAGAIFVPFWMFVKVKLSLLTVAGGEPTVSHSTFNLPFMSSPVPNFALFQSNQFKLNALTDGLLVSFLLTVGGVAFRGSVTREVSLPKLGWKGAFF